MKTEFQLRSEPAGTGFPIYFKLHRKRHLQLFYCKNQTQSQLVKNETDLIIDGIDPTKA